MDIRYSSPAQRSAKYIHIELASQWSLYINSRGQMTKPMSLAYTAENNSSAGHQHTVGLILDAGVLVSQPGCLTSLTAKAQHANYSSIAKNFKNV